MTRARPQHITGAAGAILGDRAVIAIGSQAILGRYPEGLPAEARESVEQDILPLDDAGGRKADQIDGSIGGRIAVA